MQVSYNNKNYDILYDKVHNTYRTPFQNDLFMMKIMLRCLENA